jgi:predicted DNA-binding transcriptional regulator AlpA
MNVNEILNYPNVQVVLNIADLKELFLQWQSEVSNDVTPVEEVYLTPDEVASKYHVSKVTLWRNAKNGVWPKPKKIGRRSLYLMSEIEKVLNPNKIGG